MMSKRKLTYRIFIQAIFILPILVACTANDISVPDVEPKPDQEDMCIRWNVIPEGMDNGRAMVEDYDALKIACMSGGGGQSIGIWSAYELDGVETRNVLGNPDGDVSLVYYENVPTNEEGVEMDNWQGWLYGDSAVHWTPYAKYTFNAYFPMTVIDEISTSDVSTFVVDYNTEHYQEDLMMAYSYVDTKAGSFDSKAPVELNMLHVLSAVRFRFMFMNNDNTTYNDTDKITACWLENSMIDQGLATTAVLAFGTRNEDGTMDGEHIHWYSEDYPVPSTASHPRHFYAWEDKDGVSFASTTTSCTPGVAHSTNQDGKQRFGQNDGWILIVPQQMDGTTLLGFKLATTGELEHRINLPAATFEPGKRYTYDIRFGRTEVDVKLSIAPWNELKSSQNIPL